MRTFWTFVRASWLTQSSYKIAMVFAIGSLIFQAIPIFYITNGLQGVMAPKIAGESGQYFAFVLVGTIAFYFVTEGLGSVAGVVNGTVGGGWFEQLLASPTPLPLVLASLTGYGFLWMAIRMLILAGMGALLGAQIVWGRMIPGLAILLPLTLVYVFISTIGAALIIAFRTQGPLSSGILLLSGALGGIWYTTDQIPAWGKWLVPFIPLSYGARAFRKVVLNGYSLSDVSSDIAYLVLFASVLGVAAILSMRYALRYARRNGTLSQT